MAILAACIPVVLLGVQVANVASGLLKESILSNAGLSARVEASQVEDAISDAAQGVDQVADDETFQRLVLAQADSASVNPQLQTFAELLFGRFTTEGMVGLKLLPADGGAGPSQGRLDAQTEAARLGATNDSLLVGAAFLVDGEPHIPIIKTFTPGGGGIGMQIVTEWNVNAMLDGVIDPSNVRTTERTLLLQPNSNGTNIALLRSDSTEIGQNISVATTPVLGMEQPGEDTVDEFGFSVVQASARVEIDAGWIVVVEEHQSVAYAELSQVRLAIIAVFVASGFIILTIVGIAFRGFARRLGRMTHLAEAVASGDLTVRTGDERLDELGRLSNAFDDMTAALARDISRRERVEAQLAYQASHDSLTGLPNRHSLIEHLDNVLAKTDENLSVLFVDLDGFKEVNDRHGHGAGDVLLMRVGERLRDVLRPTDFLARLGGDEFVIVFKGVGLLEAERLASRVVIALELPFTVTDFEVSISASIGVSSTDQERSSEQLIREADIAMYRAKAMGRGRALRVTKESLREVEERVSVLSELRQAIGRGELQLELWPIGDLVTGGLAGMEATVRWDHPERGIIPPAEFLPMAQSSGFATQIDEWVITNAVELMSQWKDEGLPVDDLEMAINLTTEVFLDRRSRDLLSAEVARSSLRPSNFRIEVPELVLRGESTILKEAFDGYRALGTPVTLDRFGSDYSNVDRLPRYAIDAVKIDLALTSDLRNKLSSRALVSSLITLAEASGLRVSAAGVDDDRLRMELLELGCIRGQGEWFSGRLSVADMANLIRTHHVLGVG